ncbi:PD-(D/E)XK nuclease family protein [Roseiconus lacunae]|uniref:PD-(D/E)XK nuclease family protein n=1 Tax=Roseiconus lacunae TaxID=2605694 RepID=A0ABT7PF46_9BACT|nr:PD-(D/E)XK nuclease family protein [Roseiconus lacunae]MDM4015118.1 PD-(D/E)XK nuclease family protein [Roseiconus lacunae]
MIRLTPGPLRPTFGKATINELRGGPETLLRWLELQLGLPVVEAHRGSHVTEYATALDGVADSVITASLQTDRWATASELLSRRDELQVGGWDQADVDGLPVVVSDLALAASGREFVFPSVANRIHRVLDALDDGQVLPPHSCELADPIDRWPRKWQALLQRLTITPFVEAEFSAAEGAALRLMQTVVRGGTGSNVELDDSLRYVQSLSQTAAVEYVAATLAHDPDQLERTVILCEDDNLAIQLDAALRRYGLPTMGASACSKAHPMLQVLPLSLALLWSPVEPQHLLDFLTLPISPIPRRAANELARALTNEPGLGSSSWEESIATLCDSEADPEGSLRAKLDSWLFCERVIQNNLVPTRLVRERCAAVAKWATGLAIAMSNEPEASIELIQALHLAAGQATLLGELAQSQGTELSEPQLSRLLEEALSAGVESIGAIEAEGGPMRVRSLAEINDRCYRVIWLGLGTADASPCRWSTDQLNILRDLEIEVDDGTNSLTSLRTAEARGLGFIENALFAVLLPQDNEQRRHPLWLAIRMALSKHAQDHVAVLESLIEAGDVSSLSPFVCSLSSEEIQPPPAVRPIWSVDPSLLSDRETVSATELEDRLACPLKWVFRYRAKLRPSSIAQLPGDFQLKGSFCHKILEHAFNDGDGLPDVDVAVARVERLFDERLELDAAPLAQSGKYRERQLLRKELSHATRVLINTLSAGGYRINGIEVDVEGQAFGKPFSGKIDCLVEDSAGQEGIIDFKYGGKKYEKMIQEGRAVQLATYAYSRSEETGRFPAIAYLVLSDGLLFTPSRGPINGDGHRSVVDGPAVQAVWQEFETAITNAESWLTSDGNIPARPLQEAQEWPHRLRIVLETDLKPTDTQYVCKYCDYQHLCGLKQLL